MDVFNLSSHRRFSLGPRTTPAINTLPNSPFIEDSDYAATLSKGAAAVFGTRPITFGANQFSNPGWRRRFNTPSRKVVWRLEHTNISGSGHNGKGEILVDGVHKQYFTLPDAATLMNVSVEFGNVVDRTIELIMPYSASVIHRGVTTYGYPISAPTVSRTGLPRAVFLGDSRSQGFASTSIDKTWPELLCRLKGWQHINLGYAGGLASQSWPWGTAAGNANPDIVMITFDKNNQVVQTELAVFKADYIDIINDIRAVKPVVPIYVVSSNWISALNDNLPFKMAQYAQQEFDLVDELTLAGDTNLFYIDGLPLTQNNMTAVIDGIHLGDVGAVEQATNIAPLVALAA